MTTVKMWKPSKRLLRTANNDGLMQVANSENSGKSGQELPSHCSDEKCAHIFNTKSARFTTVLHRPATRHFRLQMNRQQQRTRSEGQARMGAREIASFTQRQSYAAGGALARDHAGCNLLLLQSVHQSRDRAVQFLVRAPHLFDLVDGMEDRGVMLAAKLPSNFR